MCDMQNSAAQMPVSPLDAGEYLIDMLQHVRNLNHRDLNTPAGREAFLAASCESSFSFNYLLKSQFPHTSSRWKVKLHGSTISAMEENYCDWGHDCMNMTSAGSLVIDSAARATEVFRLMLELQSYASNEAPGAHYIPPALATIIQREFSYFESTGSWPVDYDSGNFSDEGSEDAAPPSVLTEELLLAHNARQDVREDARSSAGSSYSDHLQVAPKELANLSLVRHHGPHDTHSHAIYLDGVALRTTRVLLDHGWPATKLHVPNFVEHDVELMRGQGFGINLYPMMSTPFLRALTPAHPQLWSGLSTGVSPVSLAYMDYTRSRQKDLQLLAAGGLLKHGVLAVTCPAHAEGHPASSDRHIQQESNNVIRVGGIEILLNFEWSGLFKFMFEVALLWRAELKETILYRAARKRTWMWFCLFRVSHFYRERTFDPHKIHDARHSQALAEMHWLVLLRCIIQRKDRSNRRVTVTFEELEALLPSEYPALHALVLTFNEAVASRRVSD